MKIVATIEARMASSRLPGKVLLPILGRPMLELLIERVKRSKKIDEIVIATTMDASDDILVKKSRDWQVGIYRGSTNDVLDRVLKAAKKHQADIIVELTGDCPLLDPEIIDRAIETFQRNKVDYVANVTLDDSFPRGLDVQVFPKSILAQVARETSDPFDREHVSLYIYSHPEKFSLKKIEPHFSNKIPKLRLTVDTERDLELIRRIYHLLYYKNQFFTISDILSLFKRFPQLLTINNQVKQKPAHYDHEVLKKIKTDETSGRFAFKPTYKAAIIGCGNMGSLFDNDPKRISVSSHAGAYNTHPSVKLVAASDLNRQTLINFGVRWDVDRLYQDYLELLQKEKPDIISIVTKNDLHYRIAKDAVKHGVKAIFCEKPFTDNPQKAREIVTLCRENNVVLTIHYNRRFDKTHRKLKSKVKHLGSIVGGTIYYVNGFINNGCHAIDLVRMFLGKINFVQTISKNSYPSSDPNLSITLTLANGAEIFLKGMTTDYYLFEADLVFTEGRIRLLDRGLKIELYRIDDNATISGSKTIYSKPIIYTGMQDEIAEAIVNIVGMLNKKNKNLSSGRNAQEVLETVAACYHSWKLGGLKIKLPLLGANYSLNTQVKTL